MPYVNKTAPNGEEVEVWISRNYWQEEETQKEITRKYKSIQQPFWVLAATWLLVGLLGWSIVQSADFYEVIEEPSAERKAYQLYIIGRFNHGSMMPELRPVRPDAQEVKQFYNKTIRPMWQTAVELGESLSYEDYFVVYEQVILACEKNNMPLHGSLGYSSELGFWWNDAIHMSARNGWRDTPDLAAQQRVAREIGDMAQTYRTWYETGTVYVPKRPAVVDWHASKNLFLWALLSYLKGVLICGLIFIIRLKGNQYFTLKDEFRFGAKRFAMMVLGWPVSFWVYPYHTKTALYARKLRLEAEYLRDKKLGYWITATERERIERMAQQTAFSLKSLIRSIAASQAPNKRKALTVVYVMMLFGIFASALARVSMVAQPIVLIQVVSSFQQLDNLPSERDGPEAPVTKRFGFTEMFALAPQVLTSLGLNLSSWTRIEADEQGPPGYGKDIDHIPISSLKLRFVIQT